MWLPIFAVVEETAAAAATAEAAAVVAAAAAADRDQEEEEEEAEARRAPMEGSVSAISSTSIAPLRSASISISSSSSPSSSGGWCDESSVSDSSKSSVGCWLERGLGSRGTSSSPGKRMRRASRSSLFVLFQAFNETRRGEANATKQASREGPHRVGRRMRKGMSFIPIWPLMDSLPSGSDLKRTEGVSLEPDADGSDGTNHLHDDDDDDDGGAFEVSIPVSQSGQERGLPANGWL